MTGGGGGASFDFSAMLHGLTRYVNNVQSYLSKLESATSGTVNLGQMFQMQFQMQVLSQYIEAVSNTLSAVHNEMVTMARATKGQ
jgi:flagellar biosynthesis chaperone FliJ